MRRERVLSLREQCQRAGVPFFFKQWGGFNKKKAGRELDGLTYDEMPARVALPVLGDAERLAALAEIEAPFPAAVGPNPPDGQ
jgi:hypothetical protein